MVLGVGGAVQGLGSSEMAWANGLPMLVSVCMELADGFEGFES